MRFLRGHKFDVGLAAEMCRTMLLWRLSSGVAVVRDAIVADDLQPADFPHHGRVMKYYPCTVDFVRRDRGDRPVQLFMLVCVQPSRRLRSQSGARAVLGLPTPRGGPAAEPYLVRPIFARPAAPAALSV